MFVYAAGDKVIRKRVGYVADYCLFCREIQCHELHRVGQTRHVYFISLGEGTTIGFERRCDQCHNEMPAEADLYQDVAGTKFADVSSLEKETFPAVRDFYAERIADDQRIKRGQRLSSEARSGYILEIFDLLNPPVEARYAAAHLDKWSVGSALAMIPAFVLLGVFREQVIKTGVDIGVVLMCLIGLSIAIPLLLVATDGGRFLKRRIYPALVYALAPLDPTKEEIQSALQRLRQFGLKIGRKVSARKLRRLIEENRDGNLESQ